jgi:hypothetical protein
MSAIIRQIAQEILDMQDGGVDELDDVVTAVGLVLRGIYAAGYVVATEYQHIRTTNAIDLTELDV